MSHPVRQHPCPASDDDEFGWSGPPPRRTRCPMKQVYKAQQPCSITAEHLYPAAGRPFPVHYGGCPAKPAPITRSGGTNSPDHQAYRRRDNPGCASFRRVQLAGEQCVGLGRHVGDDLCGGLDVVDAVHAVAGGDVDVTDFRTLDRMAINVGVTCLPCARVGDWGPLIRRTSRGCRSGKARRE